MTAPIDSHPFVRLGSVKWPWAAILALCLGPLAHARMMNSSSARDTANVYRPANQLRTAQSSNPNVSSSHFRGICDPRSIATSESGVGQDVRACVCVCMYCLNHDWAVDLSPLSSVYIQIGTHTCPRLNRMCHCVGLLICHRTVAKLNTPVCSKWLNWFQAGPVQI